ncbi:conserved hypothetical protein [Shewanella sediminis HAW-EB3]|uniref:Phosphate-selective porin O and P n=1 Tax=Shewanella sediminis (strain HAW-EB3) TaxID=425104 RepID=A8FT09_SHESH|nr:hypothetical protein [Shewanella sediminis]ABV35982.1 conserved hypothetical protein [Shewanella sediminis HAW-EB3]
MNKVWINSLLLVLFSDINVVAADSPERLEVGGAVKVNYKYIDYNQESKHKGGDLVFDVTSIKFSGKNGQWGLESDYRFTADSHYVRYGYGYYDVSNDFQIQFGVNQTPFGNIGVISNSYWFGLPYYLGFEDDHDVGIKSVYKGENFRTEFAFYKNAEYEASETKRYGADLYSGKIGGIEYFNEEVNQFNLRHTYFFDHEAGGTALGVSLQYGDIYNSQTGNMGERTAYALHLDSHIYDWNIQLQLLEYQYDAAEPVGSKKIAVSVVGATFEVASKAQVYSVNIAKNVPTSWGRLKLYNDFGLMTPDVDDSSYDNSMQNVTGFSAYIGSVVIMLDYIMGNNMTFSTADNNHIGLPCLGEGWDKRVNFNLAYYF